MAERSPGAVEGGEPGGRRIGGGLAVGIVEVTSYALVALVAVAGALGAAGHVVGDGVDLYGTFWFFWWIKDCLEQARDPSFTDMMFHPLGKNIFAHTGNNFVDALASVPFQAAFGFPRYQPWFIGLVLFVNGLSFRPLAREILGPGRPWSVWTSTILWMICPFTLFELMCGRLTQAFLWFLPPAILWFLRIGHARRGRLGWLVAPTLAGLFTGLQGWTYWFMGWFMAFAFAWLAVGELRRGIVSPRRLALGWLTAALVCGLVIAPGALAMASAADQELVPGLVADSADTVFAKPKALANNVAPMLHGVVLMERFGQPMFTTWTWGAAALLVLLFAGKERRRWFGLLLFFLLFGVGPILPDRDGNQWLPMPHYQLAYRFLPYFDRLWFPYRMEVMSQLAAAVGLGVVLSRLEGALAWRLKRATGLVFGAVVLLFMAEQNEHLAYPLLHRDFTPPSVYRWLHDQPGSLIELPIGMSRISISWQAVHERPTFGGMAENAQIFWPEGMKRRMSLNLIRFLKDVTYNPSTKLTVSNRDKQRLLDEGFRWVVMDRHLVDCDLFRPRGTALPSDADQIVFRAQDRVSAELGPPVAVDGELVVWDLAGEAVAPAALQPTAQTLSHRTWTTEDMPEYERHLREVGRFPADGGPGGGGK